MHALAFAFQGAAYKLLPPPYYDGRSSIFFVSQATLFPGELVFIIKTAACGLEAELRRDLNRLYKPEKIP